MTGLVVLAVAEAELAGAVGLAHRDPVLAQAWEQRALDVVADLLPDADRPELTVASLLRHPDPTLALDGGPDGYWQALTQLAVVAAWDGVQVPAFGALHDIDAALSAADVAGPGGLVAGSHRPSLGLPDPLDVAVRVVPAATAAAAARAWLDADSGSDGTRPFTRFCQRYLGLAVAAAHVGRPAPDWLVCTSIGLELAAPFRPVAWPPVASSPAAPHPAAVALADRLLAAVPAVAELTDPAELHARFDSVEGLYVRDGHRLEWRFADGLARVTLAAAQGEPERHLGRLTPAWGGYFDSALTAAQFPSQPSGTGTVATLTLGSASVTIPPEALSGPYGSVVDLLDGVLATLAPATSDRQPEPTWVVPVES